MKLRFPLFCLLILFSLTHSFAQNTWTVGPSSQYDFTSLQDAHDAASANDIILVHPNGYTTSSTILTKRLEIYGTGYFLNENPETQVQPSPLTSEFNSITLDVGSEGTVLSGLDVNTINIRTNNTVVKGCLVHILDLEGTNSTLIAKNYITSRIRSLISSVGDVNLNILAQNNVFVGGGVDDAAYMEAVFLNNVFLAYGASVGGASNSIFKNNVFVGNTFFDDLFGSKNNLVEYNVFDTNNFYISASNLTDVDPNTIFVGYPTQGTHSTDGRFLLAPGSPAIGAGEGGVDCGIFGGTDPYVLSGLPPIPNVYEISIPDNAINSINVVIKAKANH